MASIVYHGKQLSLYNIAKYILEYDKLGPKHKEWCDRYEEIKKSGRQRILLMKPRGTYKTTIYSVANIIDILMDDWVATGGTFDKRILLTSSTEDMAIQILSEVRQHLKNNPNLKEFFGYDPVESYNQREIQLFPRSVHKEPSIKAKGAMSAIVSEHYDVIIVDDLCFDKETEVLTKEGWKYFKDVGMNDQFATIDDEDNMYYESPTRLIKKPYKGEMIGVNHKHCNFLVTPDHNMLFKKGHSNDYEKYPASEIEGMYGKFKKIFNWTGVRQEFFVLEAAEYRNGAKETEKVIPMDDFLPFLGLYLSEGCIQARWTKPSRIMITQSYVKNPETCEYIRKVMSKLPYKVKEYKSAENINFTINSTVLATYLHQFGHYAIEKFIPRFIFDLPKEQIDLFLEAYFIGDGYWSSHNERIFCTSSPKMADDLHELCLKAGKNASKHTYNSYTVTPDGKEHDTIVYRVVETKEKFNEACVRNKHWYRQEYDDYVYCVEIPNHKILIRRNGVQCWLFNCNNDDRESFAVRERKKRWFIDLISILNPTGLLLVVGTRWHLDDVYQYILTNNPNLPQKDQYHIEIEAIYDKDTGQPLFPSIYSMEDVDRLKVEKGLVEFYSQYMNDPLPAETKLFKIEEFKFYTDNDKDFEDAKHVIYVDPALGRELDYSVIIVGAIKDNKFYLRDVFASNIITPDKLIVQIEFFFHRYNAHIVGIEANQFQTLFAQSVKRRGIPVHEVKNFKKKQLRIEGLAPYVTSGVVLFRDDWMQHRDYQEAIEQLVKYPVHKHDDAPDALEGAVRIGLRNRGIYTSIAGLLLGAKRK